MKAVIQRVSYAEVLVNQESISKIDNGLLVLCGFTHDDALEDLMWMAQKIKQLRIFNDDQQQMNISLTQIKGAILVVSQFTLHAATKKGNRPSFLEAAPSNVAIVWYQKFIKILETDFSGQVHQGVFGAAMQVKLINEGPVTLIIDSKNKN